MGDHPCGIKIASKKYWMILWVVIFYGFHGTHGHEVVDQAVVEVLSTQVSVSGSGFDLENSVFNREDRHIKGSAAQVEDEDVALGADLFVKTVGDGGGGRFVDDSKNVQARNGSRVLRGLALAEVRG